MCLTVRNASLHLNNSAGGRIQPATTCSSHLVFLSVSTDGKTARRKDHQHRYGIGKALKVYRAILKYHGLLRLPRQASANYHKIQKQRLDLSRPHLMKSARRLVRPLFVTSHQPPNGRLVWLVP
jgi:hypothetical protein